MPSPAFPQQESLEQSLRAANQRFYAAFESLDFGQMEGIWLHEDWVQCVHPGWDLLVGWDEVRDSWARIFANTKRIKLALSSVRARVEGEVAWVACTEHVTSLFSSGFDEALVQATNIFVLREGEWALVARHSSPLPPETKQTVQ
ncbi:MAG: nuclear transport factor 2 family protein [Candidatus Acidiferrales bacterium]